MSKVLLFRLKLFSRASAVLLGLAAIMALAASPAYAHIIPTIR